MNNFFVYCSVDQAYHTLITNSIVSDNLTLENMRSCSPSLLNNNYIFITKEKMSVSCRRYNISENSYPIAIELDNFEASEAKVLFVYENDGVYSIEKDFLNISSFCELENCIGAFVYGYIPFHYINNLIFENEKDMRRFVNASPDIWFPHDIFKTWKSEAYRNQPVKIIKMDEIRKCADSINDVIPASTANKLNSIISNFNRVKAGIYFALEASQNWQENNVVSNTDQTLLNILEYGCNKRTLSETFEKRRFEIIETFNFINSDLLKRKDIVLEEKENINYKMFQSVARFLLYDTKPDVIIKDSSIGTLLNSCRITDGSLFESDDLNKNISKVENYFSDSSGLGDPTVVINELEGYPVLQALLLLIDCQKESSFLVRGSKKVSQEVRRYAYILFGLYRGMYQIPGERKNNRLLDSRIESIIWNYYRDKVDYMPAACNISDLADAAGFSPEIHVNMDSKRFMEYIQNEADEDTLRLIYDNTLRDEIPKEDVMGCAIPIYITYQSAKYKGTEQNKKEYEINSLEDAENFAKTITDFVKNKGRKFNSKLFKNKLKEQHYSALYNKFCQ